MSNPDLLKFLHDILLNDPDFSAKYGAAFQNLFPAPPSTSDPSLTPGTSKAFVPSEAQNPATRIIAIETIPFSNSPPRDQVPPPVIRSWRDAAYIAELEARKAKKLNPSPPRSIASEDSNYSETKLSSDDDESHDESPDELAVPMLDLSDIDVDDDGSYATLSHADDEDDTFVASSGKRKKTKSPSYTQKARKAARKTSSKPLASSKVQTAPPAPATTPPRNNRPPSPMVIVSNKKLPPPPPIYLQDKAKWSDVSQSCSDLHINYSKATSCQQGIKIQVPTARDYRELTRFLKGKNISFHTYSLPEDTPIRVVIRRIPKEIPADQIRDDLLSQKVPVLAVHRLHKARGGQEYDMVLVVVSRTEGHNPIFNIKTVCSLSGISIEKPFRPHLVGQCHRCQLYGHSQTNCFATPRCVKCLGDHGTQDCPRPKDRSLCTEPPSCVLCGQVGHPANYRGCPKAPKLAPKMAKRFDARQERQAQPDVRFPSSQIPPRLAPQRTSPWGKLNHLSVASQPNPQTIPSLMAHPISAPTPIPNIEAPPASKPAQSRKVAPTTNAAKCPPPVAPSGQKPYLSVAENICSAYSIWMSPEARALDAEIRAAGRMNPFQCMAVFTKYQRIAQYLDSVTYIDGQWVEK